MERSSNNFASSPEVLTEFLQVEAFVKLSSTIGKVIKAHVDMPVVGAITLYASLLTFTLCVHSDRLDYVDQVLYGFAHKNMRQVSFLQVEVLFELIKGLIRDLDGPPGG
ncbi:hypothetical protein LguiB_024221 [Lonicera macranthoides]